MKIVFWLILILLFSISLACEKRVGRADVSVSNPLPSPTTTVSVSKDGDYNAKGWVTKIDLELGSVELDHENIPGLMPPMVMEFYVGDKLQLKPLKTGDKVDFVLEYKNLTETIISIKKAQ